MMLRMTDTNPAGVTTTFYNPILYGGGPLSGGDRRIKALEEECSMLKSKMMKMDEMLQQIFCAPGMPGYMEAQKSWTSQVSSSSDSGAMNQADLIKDRTGLQV
jgi:hypothetical protein